jgi:hypothetical protein
LTTVAGGVSPPDVDTEADYADLLASFDRRDE